ncbi:Ribonuclease H [Candidatus Magnetoovum chiemensis]|nr:Ribonuclease H [Candidatus Magnetoovum chiemensis]
MTDMPKVEIYTDGACLGNPGPGGFAALLRYNNKRKEITKGFKLTTNNRMELMGVIAALEALKVKCTVVIYTDSKLVVDGIKKGWAKKWKSRDWIKSDNKKALNSDLWAKLLELCSAHNVTFKWIEGHAGNADNEYCDELSKKAAKGNNLFHDMVYEASRITV